MEIINDISKQVILYREDLPKDLRPGKAICIQLFIPKNCLRYVPYIIKYLS